MSEHQKETAFLRHCLRYGGGAEHQAMDEVIVQIQKDERCVRHAVWLMALTAGLTAVGLGYGTVLIENFPQDASQLIAKIIFALGLASMTSLVVFIGLGVVYRQKLDRRREECRRMISALLESRLGAATEAMSRKNHEAEGNSGAVRMAHIGDGFPGGTKSSPGC
jgi:hypothetical protein